jgi:hypothetical protein
VRHSYIAVAALLVAGTAACAPKEAAPPKDTAAAPAAAAAPATPPVVTITAKDYAFDAPASIPGGVVTLHLVNQGKDLHHLQLIKLGEGKTADSAVAAFKSQGPPPAWMTDVGGPNAPVPGGEFSLTTNLEPGNYVIVCFVDTPDHVPHLAKGMVHPLTVTASTTPDAPLPTADATLTMKDYTFDFAPPISAGKHVVKLVNAGPQPHEVLIVRFPEGKKMGDLMKWAEKYQGPPPALPLGGSTAVTPGKDQYVSLDLEPGHYGMLCFVPDAKDGKPHLMHGMAKEFDVK